MGLCNSNPLEAFSEKKSQFSLENLLKSYLISFLKSKKKKDKKIGFKNGI